MSEQSDNLQQRRPDPEETEWDFTAATESRRPHTPPTANNPYHSDWQNTYGADQTTGRFTAKGYVPQPSPWLLRLVALPGELAWSNLFDPVIRRWYAQILAMYPVIFTSALYFLGWLLATPLSMEKGQLNLFFGFIALPLALVFYTVFTLLNLISAATLYSRWRTRAAIFPVLVLILLWVSPILQLFFWGTLFSPPDPMVLWWTPIIVSCVLLVASVIFVLNRRRKILQHAAELAARGEVSQ